MKCEDCGGRIIETFPPNTSQKTTKCTKCGKREILDIEGEPHKE